MVRQHLSCPPASPGTAVGGLSPPVNVRPKRRPTITAGLLRVEDPARFSFLDPATARPGKSYPMEMVTDEIVNFDDAFADHISPGAIMVEASYFDDAYTYEAAILTAKGQVVLVSCPYIP